MFMILFYNLVSLPDTRYRQMNFAKLMNLNVEPRYLIKNKLLVIINYVLRIGTLI